VQRDFEREEHRRRLHRDEEYWGPGRGRGYNGGRRDVERDFDPDEYGEGERESYGPQTRGGYRGERARFEQERGPNGEPPYGRSSSPYDQGEISSWYGGDSGMGDYGASQPGPGAHEPHSYGQRQFGGQRERGQFDREPYDPRGSHRDTQDRSPYGRAHYEEGQHGGRLRFQRDQRSGGSSDWRQSWDRAMQGPFAGRGPRGYRRSDERILEDVCELLLHHDQIDASQMEVDVRDGEVYLRGLADSGHVRRLAEEVVEGVSGVRDVRNELRVNPRTGYGETSHDEPTRADQQRRESSRYERTSRGGALDTDAPAYGTGVANTSGAVRTGEQTQHAQAGGDRIGSRFTVRESMEVAGSDGESVGQVSEVRGTDFLLTGPRQHDVYVPFSAIRTVDGDRVMLDARSSDLDAQGWPTPDLTGTSQQRPSGGG
jgi:hypothetical protein